ncbi:MAG: outer membrane lipoprotein-sorting protein [Myxococcales bacterium]|nr:outer membrane lipoprotein-sorting protein [Myxococcales bacterium]
MLNRPLPNQALASAAWTGLAFLLASPSHASPSPEARGLAIAKEADRRDVGFGDHTARVQMILRNRHGQESRRDLRLRTLEVRDDGDKLFVVFDQPRDVRGTAFLSHTHSQGADDQWLFLPALRRVKRIASHNKSGPFVGSEFAYEDLASQEVDKYRYRYLGKEEVAGQRAFMIERKPIDQRSGYARQIAYLDTEHYRPLKVVFFDRGNRKLKTLTYERYQQYLGQYWRADRMHMENHQTGKTTELLWSKYRFRTGLERGDFEQAALRRAR